jgi:hypothetical protein
MIFTDSVTPVPMAGELIIGIESTVVLAPYDHVELGRVPAISRRGIRWSTEQR